MKNGKRKLAAIMFTDIVGYSALSHKNESLALAILAEHRVVVRPFIQQHHGVEIKTIGDAFLVEFGSAFDAVECASAIQAAHAERNRNAPPERQLLIRVGIHLGDVVESDGDVYGDGVNIAARLQYLSAPGGICVSQSIFDQVHNKLDNTFFPLGERRLKGIAVPMRIYAVNPAGALPSARWGHNMIFHRGSPVRRPSTLGAAAVVAVLGMLTIWKGVPPFGPGPSVAASDPSARIAVLPFQSISLEEGDEYLSEGMTEELISSLSRIGGLRVMARASVMHYQNGKRSMAQIGSELKIGTLVQGSVRRQGEKLRISVQISDAVSQENVWSQTFDGKASEVFDIQKRIALQICNHFRGRNPASIGPAGAPAVTEPPKSGAYVSFLKGRYFMARRTKEGLLKGIDHLEASIAQDPSFAPAPAAMANAYGLLAYYGHLPPLNAMVQEMRYVEQALALDPNSAEALISLAEKQAYSDHDYAGAEQSFRRALAAQPGYSTAHQWFGEFLTAMNRPREAEQELRAALELDPLSLVTNTAAGVSAYFDRNYPKAIRHYQAAIDMDPGFVLSHYWLGRTYVQQGQAELGIGELEKATSLAPADPMMKAALAHAYAVSGRRDQARRLLAHLTANPSGSYLPPHAIAAIYAGLGDAPSAMKYLQRSFDERTNQILFLKVDPVFDGIRAHPAFVSMLRQLRL